MQSPGHYKTSVSDTHDGSARRYDHDDLEASTHLHNDVNLDDDDFDQHDYHDATRLGGVHRGRNITWQL